MEPLGAAGQTDDQATLEVLRLEARVPRAEKIGGDLGLGGRGESRDRGSGASGVSTLGPIV